MKRAINLDTKEIKYLKLSFFETFEITLGGIAIQCFRNPEKEGEILDLVRGHPYFMQGSVLRDKKQNNVRVLDAVRGKNLLNYIGMFEMPYDTYYKTDENRFSLDLFGLGNILMHFSSGTEIMYETVDEIVEDLNRCLQAFS